MNDASEKEKINQARKQAIASIRASVPPDEKHFRYSETPQVKEAEAKVNKLADAKIAELNEKGKKSGAKTKTKTKRPELSAGYDAIVSSGKEELELLGKLSSAQEKLLGYVVPETLSRKQAVEVSQEQFNIQSKMAKIQEQLKKDNLGSGVRESLQKTLEMYKKRTDFVSEELAVTHALQKEQNNIKIYQEDILKPAQRRNDIEKELLSYYVQTGELSSAEANRQTLINSQKMIEMEYAGNIAQAQETFNSLQSAGYEEAAKNAQKRLSSLESEREAKLKIAQIKLDGEADAKKFEAIIQSFSGSLGVLDGGTTVQDAPMLDSGLMDENTSSEVLEMQNFQKLEETINDYLEQNELSESVTVLDEEAGLLLRFQDNILFDSGSADLKAQSQEIMSYIAELLNAEDFKDKFISIEGHTDNVPMNSAKYPSNWELSVGRSSNVVRFLVEDNNMDPKRISASGYSEYHPVASNENNENRAKNRRVDILILKTVHYKDASKNE